MCNPVAIALLAGGFAANEYGNRKVEKATKNALRSGMAEQRQLQGNLNDEVLKTAKEIYDPSSQAARYAEAATGREQALGAAMSDINAAPAGTAAGQMSEDFLKAKAGKTAEQMDAIAKLTRLMGRASAGDTVRLNDSVKQMESNDRLTGIGSQMRDARDLMQTRIGEAAHAGDRVKTVGQLMQLAGLMYNPAAATAGTGQAATVGLGRGMMGTGAATSASGASATRMFGALA